MRSAAANALRQVDASQLADKPLEIMSAGEARRILIARALAHRPRALLLDEPTAGLDIAARRRFLETLRDVAAEGRTLLLVTHHVDEIIPEIGRVILMKDGAVYADGAKERGADFGEAVGGVRDQDRGEQDYLKAITRRK